jgi:hypothetical protein
MIVKGAGFSEANSRLRYAFISFYFYKMNQAPEWLAQSRPLRSFYRQSIWAV